MSNDPTVEDLLERNKYIYPASHSPQRSTNTVPRQLAPKAEPLPLITELESVELTAPHIVVRTYQQLRLLSAHLLIYTQSPAPTLAASQSNS